MTTSLLKRISLIDEGESLEQADNWRESGSRTGFWFFDALLSAMGELGRFVLESSSEESDLEAIRTALCSLLDAPIDKVDNEGIDQSVDWAVDKFPNVFAEPVDSDIEANPNPEQWDREYYQAQRTALMANFTEGRYRHLQGVRAELGKP